MTALGKRGISSSREDGHKPWMVKMQSPRVQCCLCACCVMSALLGMSMLSVGVCLVLNYNLVDVDTSGLPSNLQNDSGKKVVGIILICVGVGSVIMSGIISTLYFTVCSRREPHSAVRPKAQQPAPSDSEKGATSTAQGGTISSTRRPSSRESHGGQASHLHHHHHYKHLHGNGSAAGRNSPNARRSSGSQSYGRNGGAGLPVPGDPMNRSQVSLGKDGPSYSRSNNSGGGMKGSRSHHTTPPSSSSSRSHHRRVKKGRPLGGRHFKNPLAPHPEEAGAESQSLNESRRSASSSRRLQGVVNRGADLEDDLEMTQESVVSVGSSGSSSTVGHSVIVKVGPCHASPPPSPTRRPSHHGVQETQFTGDFLGPADSAGAMSSQGKLDDGYEDDYGDGSDGSGRMSRSTMDSLDNTLEGEAEEGQDAHRRLDTQIQELVNS